VDLSRAPPAQDRATRIAAKTVMQRPLCARSGARLQLRRELLRLLGNPLEGHALRETRQVSVEDGFAPGSSSSFRIGSVIDIDIRGAEPIAEM